MSSPEKTNDEKIWQIVYSIPRGSVATYGQVANLAGLPRQARLVGYALNAVRDDSVPWHRVINSKGGISKRSRGKHDSLQREMLEDEGIEFSPGDKISLQKYRWHQR